MSGGYVGVSVFFTLSGYLITSMLLVEWDRDGDIAIGAFFARRLRRLLPASMACLASVVLIRLAGGFGSVAGVRADLLGAIAHVFNWLRISRDASYAQVFDGSAALTSPLEHYWSLAIEEQFYLVWPFVMIVLLRRRGRRRVGRTIFAGYVLAATATPLLATRLDSDTVYWSTPTRLAELLAGAALGAIILNRRLPPRVGRLASPSLLVIVTAAVVWPSGAGPAYTGWMGIFALASVGLIAGLQGESRLVGILSSTSLVGLGRISYGVYLFHWPVFVWLRQQGWDLASPPRFVVAVLLVLVLAALSNRYIEQRIRSNRAPAMPSIAVSVSAMAFALSVAAIVPISRGFLEADQAVLASASAGAEESIDVRPLLHATETGSETNPTESDTGQLPSDSEAAGGIETTEVAASSNVGGFGANALDAGGVAPGEMDTDLELTQPGHRPIRMVVIGDSTAFYVGQALARWSVGHPGYATVDLATCDGCGFLLDGTVTSWNSDSYSANSIKLLDERVPALIHAVRPDVVVLMSTMSDVADRRWSDEEGVLAPQDDAFETRLRTAYAAVTSDILGAGVADVVWVEPPVPIWPGPEVEMREVERWDVMARVIGDVAGTVRDGQVTVVDGDAWMHAAGFADDVSFRPDGTHLTEASAGELVDRWLAPTLVHLVLGSP